MEIKENDLISSAQKGDLDSFNRLVLAYQSQVFNVALRILGDTNAADDAAQNAFIAAYRKITTFHGGSFRSWLLTIVTHQCYDELRARKRKPTVSLEPDLPEDEAFQDSSEWLADDKPSPEQISVTRELEKAIQHCIDKLPEDFKMIAVLVDVEGLDYKDAAQIVSIPLGTIKSRLARARQRLRDCLHGFGELLPEEFRHMAEETT